MMNVSMRGWMVVGVLAAMCSAIMSLGPGLSAQTADSNRLTVQSLGDVLKDLGLRPKKDGERYDFSFRAKHQGQDWELTMSAVLSRNGDSMWIMAWLDELPKNSDDVAKSALLRLLANNDRLGKGKFFAYVAGNRRFVLQRVVENEGINAREMAALLADLGGSVAETYPFWAVENWPKTASQAKPISSASRESKFSGSTRN